LFVSRRFILTLQKLCGNEVKRFVILLSIWFFAIASYSQPKGRFGIYGTISDSFTHEPLDTAVVTLLSADSSTVLQTKCLGKNDAGDIYMPVDSQAQYLLRIESPKYGTEYRSMNVHFSKLRKRIYDLGTVLMRRRSITEGDYLLNEVLVKGTRIKMVLRGDTIVYDAAAFQLSQGSMLDALVRQLPGVKLSGDGKITVNGRFVESLLINGKDFFKGDVKIAMDNLPAYMVNDVKVYEKAGDYEKALGIKNNQKQNPLVMDVNLKHKYDFGWMANVDGGAGTDNRYQGKFFAMRYSNYSHIYIYGNMGNINDDSAPGESGDWSSTKGVNGRSANKVFGLQTHIDDRQKRFEILSSATYSHTSTDDETIASTERFLTEGNTYSRYHSLTVTHTTNVKFDNTFTWKKENSGLYLTVNPFIEYYDSRSPQSSFSGQFSANVVEGYRGASLDSIFSVGASDYLRHLIINRQATRSWDNMHYINGNMTVDGNVSMKGTDDYLRFFVSGQFRDEKHHHYNIYDIRYMSDGSESSADYRHQYINSPVKQHSLHGSVSYSYRLHSDKWNVGFLPSYEIMSSYNHSPRDLFSIENLAGWGAGSGRSLRSLPSTKDSLQTVLDIQNSYYSTRRDLTQTPGISVDYNFVHSQNNRLTVRLGLQDNIQHNHLDYQRGDIDTTLVRNVSYLQPSLSVIKYNFEKGWEFLSMNYSSNVSVPDIISMLNITDTSNPLVIRRSNRVKNSRNHNFSCSYSKMTKGGDSFNVNAIFHLSRNAVAEAMEYDRTTGVTTYHPENVNGNWSSTGNVSYCVAVDSARHITIRTSTDCAFDHNVDLTALEGSGSVRSTVRNLTLGEQLNAVYENNGYRLELGGKADYTHASSSRADFTNVNCVDFSYGLTCKAPLPFGFELSSDMKMYSRRGYEDRNMNTNQLVWNAQLSKNVGSRLTFMFDAFDILHQLSSITRTMNTQCRIETWHNVLSRYLMVHAILRLSKK
jgi:hypothetical protein